MIEFILLAATAAGPLALSWEGRAEVYPPGSKLEIAVRTTIDGDGNVVSESWPVELGQAKGLRRMTLSANGGTMERGGEKRPMPAEVWAEEQAQFGIYRQLQIAAALAPERASQGVTAFSVSGVVPTWFRIGAKAIIIGAVNQVPTASGKAYQEFRFDGFLESGGAVFPKHMEMTRDGKPFFTLDVTKFDAR